MTVVARTSCLFNPSLFRRVTTSISRRNLSSESRFKSGESQIRMELAQKQNTKIWLHSRSPYEKSLIHKHRASPLMLTQQENIDLAQVLTSEVGNSWDGVMVHRISYYRNIYRFKEITGILAQKFCNSEAFCFSDIYPKLLLTSCIPIDSVHVEGRAFHGGWSKYEGTIVVRPRSAQTTGYFLAVADSKNDSDELVVSTKKNFVINSFEETGREFLAELSIL